MKRLYCVHSNIPQEGMKRLYCVYSNIPQEGMKRLYCVYSNIPQEGMKRQYYVHSNIPQEGMKRQYCVHSNIPQEGMKRLYCVHSNISQEGMKRQYCVHSNKPQVGMKRLYCVFSNIPQEVLTSLLHLDRTVNNMLRSSTMPMVCIHRGLVTSLKDAKTKALLDKVIRVDHAGELGADRIYAGQLAVLGKSSVGPLIKEMWEEEKVHREKFEKLMAENRVRPSVLLPIWNVAGFALGAATALMGKEAAMACTVAVEDVIGDHYNSQIREIVEDDPVKHKELLETVKKFRDEELHHHDIGLQHDAEKAPLYNVLSQAIKVGCKGAIWISERI
ncbi:ubiquinone biosynthesis monooxygenase Coq7 [Bulinus truncatus]|nr:ubiquinone biosynthesis monooxygenase Coq7 [Bulinus truncatus]